MLMDASKERGAETAEISRTRPVLCFCLRRRLPRRKRHISWRTQPGYHQGSGVGGAERGFKEEEPAP